jgi:fructose-bisphosphate aldolase, class I
MTPPIRLNRLLRDDGRCVVGLFDYGHYGEPSWVATRALVQHLVSDPRNRAFDAINLPRGSAGQIGLRPGHDRPALIVRADWSDLWQGGWFGNPAASPPAPGATSLPLRGAIGTALRHDAVAVIASILRTPTDPKLYAACLATVERTVAACDRYALPVLVETAAFVEVNGSLVGDYRLETQATLAWQAAEFGADLLKTDPTADPGDFSEVVAAAAGTPVLAGSGPSASEEEIRTRTADLIAAGAAGVAYGGNFARAAEPFRMAAEISSIVHQDS